MAKKTPQPEPVDNSIILDRTTKQNPLLKSGTVSDNYKMIHGGHLFENSLHISDEMFNVINNYRGTLKYTNSTLQGPAGKKNHKIIYDSITTASLFNPYYALTSANVTQNVPLLDTSKHQDPISAIRAHKDNDKAINKQIRFSIPTDDCSVSNLVKLSKLQFSPLGNAHYKYSDFMFCRDVGRISNNHMITLRRFATPIGDDIFYPTSLKDEASNVETAGDIGRLITWFNTDENKLEDILKYKYNASWKKLEAKIQEQDSRETDKARGVIGGLANLFNPNYIAAVGQGRAPSSLSLILGSDASDAFYTDAPYENNPVVNGAMYDKNRVYEPKDTLRETHTYEGKLTFNHEFTLKFPFKLRGYDNINTKAAFLDLLANILVVTYKQGTFWPGEQRIIGAPPNKAGWNKAQNFVSKGLDAGGTFISKVLNGESFGAAFDELVGSIGSAVSSLFGLGNVSIKSADMKATLKKLGSGALKAIGGEMKGLIKNKMGRPAVYAFDSLLTNDVVGTWHVTIGNPLNPIAVMGNLIMTDAEITHSGPLGLDDFPTELTVSVTLKHAKPRDSVDIQRMYTLGRKSIYSKISNIDNYQLSESASDATFDEAKMTAINVDDTKNRSFTGDTYAKNVISLDNIIAKGVSKDIYGWLGETENYRFLVKSQSLK